VVTTDYSCYPILPESAEDAKDWGCATSFQVNSNGDVTGALPPEDAKTIKKGCDVSLPSGRTAVMLDIGSVGNLAGEAWLKAMALKAVKNGRSPKSYKRARTLHVSGVGTGSQSCKFNCEIPSAVPTAKGYLKGTYKTPCVPNSTLPALMGLESLRNSRALIDTISGKVYMVGPGDYDLGRLLPPGTREIQCEYANSGHMMMPVDAFEELDREERSGGFTIEKEVVLHNQTEQSNE